ncbi:hypothetical protein [Aestuariivita boseongensis]|uniref:hypothetical protein n=1 Tax=Aestuariivita boseongensis TaxID=1470562 RepID=UPI00155DBDE5|nr:hypothetical protein [Aestuariivita boseongensis]
MLDFTTHTTGPQKTRCQLRAEAARRLSRFFRVVLAGLVGAALIMEPSMVGAARSGISTMYEYVGTNLPIFLESELKIALNPDVTVLPLADMAVAQAETSLLKP